MGNTSKAYAYRVVPPVLSFERRGGLELAPELNPYGQRHTSPSIFHCSRCGYFTELDNQVRPVWLLSEWLYASNIKGVGSRR